MNVDSDCNALEFRLLSYGILRNGCWIKWVRWMLTMRQMWVVDFDTGQVLKLWRWGIGIEGSWCVDEILQVIENNHVQLSIFQCSSANKRFNRNYTWYFILYVHILCYLFDTTSQIQFFKNPRLILHFLHCLNHFFFLMNKLLLLHDYRELFDYYELQVYQVEQEHPKQNKKTQKKTKQTG